MAETTRRQARGESGTGASPAVLVLGIRGGEPLRIVLPREGESELLVGRDASAAVRLASDDVSRRHARIHGGAPASLEDLGSANGTKVMGRALLAGERVPLPIGSVVEFGDVVGFVQSADHDPPPSARLRDRGRKMATPRAPSPTVVVEDPRMRELYELAAVVGPSGVSVMILGETGVGKDVYASHIHACSHRGRAPFVRINCAAMPEPLLESELFGFERGAFTGAAHAKPGLLESADGGTVFLDEIAEASPAIQAKLLRAVESDEVMRLGALRARPIDVRFLAATHRDLEAMVHAGRFRMDLYFRLNTMSIVLPPLRERPLDVVALAKQLLGEHPYEPAVLTKLRAHAYPGNVRELRNVVTRALLLARGRPVAPEHVLFGALSTRASASEESERERIAKAMERHGGNQKRAAADLGMPRTTLIRKLAKLGL